MGRVLFQVFWFSPFVILTIIVVATALNKKDERARSGTFNRSNAFSEVGEHKKMKVLPLFKPSKGYKES
jgi:hypothetical protein